MLTFALPIAAVVVTLLSNIPYTRWMRTPRAGSRDRTPLWDSRFWHVHSRTYSRLLNVTIAVAALGYILFIIWVFIVPGYYDAAGMPSEGAALTLCLWGNPWLMVANIAIRIVLGFVVFLGIEGIVRTIVLRIAGHRDMALRSIFGYIVLIIFAGGILFFGGSSLLVFLGNHLGCHIP